MFKTANDFCLHIEKTAKEQGLSYCDAILKYCEENYIEPADIAKMINPNLKDKIAMEMRELNYLPKQGTLDV
jgi:hypothetical protein